MWNFISLNKPTNTNTQPTQKPAYERCPVVACLDLRSPYGSKAKANFHIITFLVENSKRKMSAEVH